MQIKIKKIHPDAKEPTYATDGSGCFDLRAMSVSEAHAIGAFVDQGGPVTCGTGLAFEIPPGWAMLIFSRSGHGFKHETRLANCVGVIDSDYRGEVMVKLTSDSDSNHDSLFVKPGDRVAQALIVQAERIDFNVVDELSDTARGDGGFGSTGEA